MVGNVLRLGGRRAPKQQDMRRGMLMQLGYAGGEQKQQEMRRREQAQLEMHSGLNLGVDRCIYVC